MLYIVIFVNSEFLVCFFIFSTCILLPNFNFFSPGHQVQEHEKLKQAEKELLHKDVSSGILLFIHLLTMI